MNSFIHLWRRRFPFYNEETKAQRKESCPGHTAGPGVRPRQAGCRAGEARGITVPDSSSNGIGFDEHQGWSS